MNKLYIGIFLLVLSSCKIKPLKSTVATRVSEDIIPTLGCWFWSEEEFEPKGYKAFIDQVSTHSEFNYLTTSIRAPKVEVTDKFVHNQIKEAAIYANKNNVPIIMDLDVRLARQAFKEKYPDELQEMLILKEVDLLDQNKLISTIKSFDLGDHYTHRTTNYIALEGNLVRVYSYTRDSTGINPSSLKDITKDCKELFISKDSIQIQLPKAFEKGKTKACIMTSFTHLTPDVFAPHLIEFQHQILQQYSDVPLAGACKDEWGFPPNFDGNPNKDQFWYSKHRADSYSKITNGRDLIADCLLMHIGIKGQEDERISAINNFMKMSWKRNGEIEDSFYNSVKEIFGSQAIVSTLPTWWPYPDQREFKKNGLDWWVATRDWAQTDELTPFAVRTALSKKWKSPVWYNMFYATSISEYEKSLWSYALAGGRINYHRPYPSKSVYESRKALLKDDLMTAERRIHLLNYITKSPLDCKVAVIFGHSSAMNWAGKGYNSVGLEVADALWKEGYPTDLIPSSEIENGNIIIDKDGYISYGSQRYSAVVLYNPEFENSSTAFFFSAAEKGATELFRVGNWTKKFNGEKLDSDSILPKSLIKPIEVTSITSKIKNTLQEKNIQPQTKATSELKGFKHNSPAPPTTGFCRLIDGTLIQIAGTNNVAGDTIKSTSKIEIYDVTFDAIGVAAVRLNKEGAPESLAAGGLKHFKINDFEIKLEERMDIALWKDKQNNWVGVIQDYEGNIPNELLKITKNWKQLKSPNPL